MTQIHDYRFSMNFDLGNGTYSNLKFIVENFGLPSYYAEVGVFEGSTIFWMSDQVTPQNPNLKIYAIDPHVGSVDMSENFDDVKKNFEYNLSINTHKNVEYIPKYSEDGLIDLINRGSSMELIYIDGDHRAAGVLTDLVLAWKLLKVGGVILCDDTTVWRYTDKNGTESAQMSVRMAVEMFIQCNWHKLHIIALPNSRQTAFIKRTE